MLDLLKGSPVAAFFAAFFVALFITPLARALALRFDATAKPDARRHHHGHIAQWGGLAVFLGVLAAALVWRQPTTEDLRLLAPTSNPQDIAQTASQVRLSVAFFGCGALVLLLGMADDRWELRAWQKFGGQILIVSLLWAMGVKITNVPFTGSTVVLSDFASYFLTLGWVLTLVNGVNFIDGVDGLASGVCAIAAGALAIVLAGSAPWAACACAAICGASLGFLRHNFHPAKIFLGDSGAMLLGFWLAVIALAAASKTAAATTLAIPILVLAIPILDLVWAVVRRVSQKKAPWVADRGHIHHRLLARGMSPLKTTLFVYMIALGLAVLAVFVTRF